MWQDSKKKREEERQKQLRWREEHRSALLAGHDSLDASSGDPASTRALLRAGLGGAGRGALPGYSSPSGLPPLVVAGAQAFRQKRWRQVEPGGARGLGSSGDTQVRLGFSNCLNLNLQ